MYHKPKVGDKVFMLNVCDSSVESGMDYKVTKVGKKYFTVSYSDETYSYMRFEINNWVFKDGTYSKCKCYPSKKDYVLTLKKEEWLKKYRQVFEKGYCLNTLEELREAAKILRITLKDK